MCVISVFVNTLEDDDLGIFDFGGVNEAKS